MRRAVAAPDALSYLVAAHVWIATPWVRLDDPRRARAGLVRAVAQLALSRVDRLRGAR